MTSTNLARDALITDLKHDELGANISPVAA